MGLTELLGDDLRGGFWVKELVAQDLEHELFGASVVGLWAGLLGFQGLQAARLEVVQELVVALTAEAVFLSDGGDVVLQTLAFDEHEEATGLLVGRGDEQGAGGAGELVNIEVEVEMTVHGGKVEDRGRYVYSNVALKPGIVPLATQASGRYGDRYY